MNVQPNRLYKSTTDSMLFGVAGGMAEYFGADPTLVRVAWVLVALASAGLGLLAYVILAIIIPRQTFDSTAEESSQMRDTESSERTRTVLRRRTGRLSLFGLALIAIGTLLLLNTLGVLYWWRWDVFWPLLLIAAGVALLAGRLTRKEND